MKFTANIRRQLLISLTIKPKFNKKHLWPCLNKRSLKKAQDASFVIVLSLPDYLSRIIPIHWLPSGEAGPISSGGQFAAESGAQFERILQLISREGMVYFPLPGREAKTNQRELLWNTRRQKRNVNTNYCLTSLISRGPGYLTGAAAAVRDQLHMDFTAAFYFLKLAFSFSEALSYGKHHVPDHLGCSIR